MICAYVKPEIKKKKDTTTIVTATNEACTRWLHGKCQLMGKELHFWYGRMQIECIFPGFPT